jgi:hypothetical protein
VKALVSLLLLSKLLRLLFIIILNEVGVSMRSLNLVSCDETVTDTSKGKVARSILDKSEVGNIHSKIVSRPERKAVFYSVQRTSLQRTNDRTT